MSTIRHIESLVLLASRSILKSCLHNKDLIPLVQKKIEPILDYLPEFAPEMRFKIKTPPLTPEIYGEIGIVQVNGYTELYNLKTGKMLKLYGYLGIGYCYGIIPDLLFDRVLDIIYIQRDSVFKSYSFDFTELELAVPVNKEYTYAPGYGCLVETIRKQSNAVKNYYKYDGIGSKDQIIAEQSSDVKINAETQFLEFISYRYLHNDTLEIDGITYSGVSRVNANKNFLAFSDATKYHLFTRTGHFEYPINKGETFYGRYVTSGNIARIFNIEDGSEVTIRNVIYVDPRSLDMLCARYGTDIHIYSIKLNGKLISVIPLCDNNSISVTHRSNLNKLVVYHTLPARKYYYTGKEIDKLDTDTYVVTNGNPHMYRYDLSLGRYLELISK